MAECVRCRFGLSRLGTPSGALKIGRRNGVPVGRFPRERPSRIGGQLPERQPVRNIGGLWLVFFGPDEENAARHEAGPLTGHWVRTGSPCPLAGLHALRGNAFRHVLAQILEGHCVFQVADLLDTECACPEGKTVGRQTGLLADIDIDQVV